MQEFDKKLMDSIKDVLKHYDVRKKETQEKITTCINQIYIIESGIDKDPFKRSDIYSLSVKRRTFDDISGISNPSSDKNFTVLENYKKIQKQRLKMYEEMLAKFITYDLFLDEVYTNFLSLNGLEYEILDLCFRKKEKWNYVSSKQGLNISRNQIARYHKKGLESIAKNLNTRCLNPCI